MKAVQSLNSAKVIGAFAAAWLLVVIGSMVATRLRLDTNLGFHLMCFFSGTLAGSAVSAAGRNTPGNGAWLLLMLAGLGFSRYVRGDEGGLLVALMMGGAAIGSVVITLLPKPQEALVERSWDED